MRCPGLQLLLRLQPSALSFSGWRNTASMLALPLATTDLQIQGRSVGVLSAWAATAFCGTSSSSSFATQGHGAETATEHAGVAEPPASGSIEEISTSASNNSSSSAPADSEDLFHFVPMAQRRQKPLPTTDSVFLWSRSEEQARLGKLIKVRIGKAGITRSLLATCGDLLAVHEIVRVSECMPEGASPYGIRNSQHSVHQETCARLVFPYY